MVVSQILLSPSVPISLCQSLHTDGNPASYFTRTIPHKNVQSFPNPQLLTSLHRCHIMSSLFRRQRWGWGTYTRTEHNKTWAIELIKTHIYKDSRALSPWIPKHFFSIHLYIRNLPLQKMCVPHVHWDDPILPPPQWHHSTCCSPSLALCLLSLLDHFYQHFHMPLPFHVNWNLLSSKGPWDPPLSRLPFSLNMSPSFYETTYSGFCCHICTETSLAKTPYERHMTKSVKEVFIPLIHLSALLNCGHFLLLKALPRPCFLGCLLMVPLLTLILCCFLCFLLIY